MRITVNGTAEDLEQAMTIADYLEYKAIETILVVIEWNFTTPPREEWSRIALGDGDNLEIIKIVGGG
jgi:thiamine biosynthesis protein ThiS